MVSVKKKKGKMKEHVKGEMISLLSPRQTHAHTHTHIHTL